MHRALAPRFGIGVCLTVVWACSPARNDAEPKGDTAPVAGVPDSTPVAAAGTSWTVDASGAGPVRAGMTLAEARAALGAGVTLPAPAQAECDYVSPSGAQSGLSFMVVEGTIARVDVRDSSTTTAAGARIGDPESRIRALYGDGIIVRPHKYTTGHYLVVPRGPGADTLFRLVFETDSAGRVTTYRAGRLPEVEWVEGCS